MASNVFGLFIWIHDDPIQEMCSTYLTLSKKDKCRWRSGKVIKSNGDNSEIRWHGDNRGSGWLRDKRNSKWLVDNRESRWLVDNRESRWHVSGVNTSVGSGSAFILRIKGSLFCIKKTLGQKRKKNVAAEESSILQTKYPKTALPQAPYVLTAEEKKETDRRLSDIKVPVNFGIIPATLFQKIVGGTKCHTWLQTFYFHLLHHLPQYIRLYGPPRNFWMFPYERYNHTLTEAVSNNQYPELSAIRKVDVIMVLTWETPTETPKLQGISGCYFEIERGKIEEEIELAKFYTLLSDGSTDVSVIENEIVYIHFAHRGIAYCYFRGLIQCESADSKGIYAAILQALNFKNLTVKDILKRTVGFAGDRASVNTGQLNGVIAHFRENASSSVVMVQCISHRIELA
ncbi:unnamed protein product [Mytilus coruscus]|uniref:DUF4371 domain-containing protein n=1 Tax=Mytilus coruscus TaxID=42192 RepID=A0A6J8A9C9_MYTCO|nr:unnamed protein product [Mytilus coruscus]